MVAILEEAVAASLLELRRGKHLSARRLRDIGPPSAYSAYSAVNQQLVTTKSPGHKEIAPDAGIASVRDGAVRKGRRGRRPYFIRVNLRNLRARKDSSALRLPDYSAVLLRGVRCAGRARKNRPRPAYVLRSSSNEAGTDDTPPVIIETPPSPRRGWATWPLATLTCPTC